jgi:hypothetical protein
LSRLEDWRRKEMEESSCEIETEKDAFRWVGLDAYFPVKEHAPLPFLRIGTEDCKPLFQTHSANSFPLERKTAKFLWKSFVRFGVIGLRI